MSGASKKNISIRPSISFNQLCSVFGSEEASARYEALLEDIKDIVADVVTEGTSMNVAVKQALSLRKKILKENSSRIMPLGVHRIDVYPSHLQVKQDVNLQLSSRYLLPVFVHEELFTSNKINAATEADYAWDKATVNQCEGRILTAKEKREDNKVAGRMSFYGTPRILVVTDGEVMDKDSCMISTEVSGLKYFYGVHKDALKKYMSKVATSSSVVHICNDFVSEEGGGVYGGGVNLCQKVLALLAKGSYYSACVMNYLKVDTRPYKCFDAPELGLFYFKPM